MDAWMSSSPHGVFIWAFIVSYNFFLLLYKSASTHTAHIHRNTAFTLKSERFPLYWLL